MRILAVCKDPGGTAGLLPVVKELANRGHRVELGANGKAVEILGSSGSGQEFLNLEGSTALEVEGRLGGFDILLTSMCSRGGIGRDLVPLLRQRGTKVVAVQDFWVGAAGQEDAWLNKQYRPDRITTNDETGRNLLSKVWPDFDPNKISITGFPAFDRYAGVDLERVAVTTKQKLGLTPNLPVILFAGGGPLTHVAHSLLVKALTAIHAGASRALCYYVPRPHPRTMSDFPEEAPLWQQTLAGLAGPVVVYDFFGQCDMSGLVPAADVVCSISSTDLLTAAVARKGAISIMPDGPLKDRFRKQMAGATDQYPLVPLGCCKEATTSDELIEQTLGFLREGNTLRANQEENIVLDGQNAKRVADVVEST